MPRALIEAISPNHWSFIIATLNKVQLIGNLGRDPETRYTPNGTPVCTVSLATTNAWTDKQSGDRVEESEWHRVVFFGRLAEIVAEYMRKGRTLYVEGRLRTRQWQDKDGRDVYTAEIVASEMQMLGTKPDDGKSPVEQHARTEAPHPTGTDDDIPF